MKNIIYLSIAVLMNMLCLTSCERERLDFGNDETLATGSVSLASLKLSVESGDLNVTTRANDEMDLSSFIVKITDAAGDVEREWKYSEMPEIFSLNVGTYTVSAYNHEEGDAAFDNPYYFVSEDFEIKADEITYLDNLVCKLRSIMVTVEYDEELYALLGSDAKATIYVDEQSLEFVKDESRAGYFHASSDDQNIITTRFSGEIEGAQVDYEEAFNGIKAGEHRVVRYSIKKINNSGNGTGGTAEFKITIDADCTVVNENITVDPGKEDGIEDFPEDNKDDENNGDDNSGDDNNDKNEELPTITGKSYNGNPFDIKKDKLDLATEGTTTVQVEINAPKGIAHLYVTIDSETLTPDELQSVGLTDKFDLADAGDYESALAGLTFPVGSDVVGKTYLLFDITQFTGMLSALGAATHKFVLNVVDQAGNSATETLTLVTYDAE